MVRPAYLLFLAPKDMLDNHFGRVAQPVRALVSHTRGPGFESLRDHPFHLRRCSSSGPGNIHAT